MITAAVVQPTPETSPASAVTSGGNKEATGESSFSDLLGAAVQEGAPGVTGQTNAAGKARSKGSETPSTEDEASSESAVDMLAMLQGTRADAASAIATLAGQSTNATSSQETGSAADVVTGPSPEQVSPKVVVPEGNTTPVDITLAVAGPDTGESNVDEPALVGQSVSPVRNASSGQAAATVAATATTTDPLLPLTVSATATGNGEVAASAQTSQVETEQPADTSATTAEVPKQAEVTDRPGVQARAGSNPAAATQGSPYGQQQAQETVQSETRVEATSSPVLAAGPEVDDVAAAIQSTGKPSTDTGSTMGDGDQSQTAGLLTASSQMHRTSTEVAVRTEDATRTSTDLHQRVIDQVVRSVSVSQTDGRTDMVVKLSPPDLGTLTVHLAQDASGMTSQIQATSDQVRGLLQAHLPALVDALSDAGVKLNSVQITSDPSFGALMHNSAQEGGYQQQDNAPRHRHSSTSGGSTATLDTASILGQSSSVSSQGAASYSWLA